MQQIYQHPWYKQQELLENTTDLESKLRPKLRSAGTGPKFTKDVQWAAALFEGEGCLTYRKGNDIWELQLGMTDLDVVLEFFQVVDAGYVRSPARSPSQPDHWKSMHFWHTSKRELIKNILFAFYPYMGERRKEKIEEFMQWYYLKK